MFIFGGVTDDANSTTDRVEADFNSVLGKKKAQQHRQKFFYQSSRY